MHSEQVNTAVQIWSVAQNRLKSQLAPDTYEQWFGVVVVVELEGDKNLVLGVSDEFFADWITDNFGYLLTEALSNIDNINYTFVLKSGYTPVPVATPEPCAKRIIQPVFSGASASSFDFTETSTPSTPFHEVLASFSGTSQNSVAARTTHGVSNTNRNRFTFDNFVVGEENRYAFATARAVAQNPGVYNPLYIYGDTGIGKTHLIQAVKHEILLNNPDMKVRYASCEEILNSFVESLYRAKSQNSFSEFRSSLREVDALLVDDIHTLAKKTELQEQFFNAFNELYRMNKQIILTSDKQPCEIQGLEPRLISRFESGVTSEIIPPGYEIRLAILRQTAEEYMCASMPAEVLNFLAMNIASSVRRLKGALLRVVGSASSTNQKITVEFAERVLHELLENENNAKSVSFETIQSKVAEHFGLRLSDILSNRRPRNIAEPRMVAMYLCRKLTDGSYPEIGAAFGKNHATVLNAMDRVQVLCGENESLRRSVAQLERQLKHR